MTNICGNKRHILCWFWDSGVIRLLYALRLNWCFHSIQYMFSLVDHLPSIHQHAGADTLKTTTAVLFTQPPLRRQRPCQDLNRWLVDATLQRRQFSTSSVLGSSIKAAAIESNIYSQHLRIKHASTLIPCELVGFCQNGDAPGRLIAEEGHSGGSSQLGLARCDLEALQLHGEAHVPGDLELPLEECLGTQW